MPVGKTWVFAEAEGGKPLPLTLELLTKARQLGGEVEAFYAGGDAESIAGELGRYGATKVFTTGDLSGALVGVPAGAAMAAQIEAGNHPDLILFGMTYDGRDTAARLSAKRARPVLATGLDVGPAGDVVETAVFGGVTIVRTAFRSDPPHIAIVRPKSFAPERADGGPAEVVTVDVPDTGVTNAAKVLDRHVEEHTGPKLDEADVVVSGGRGPGAAEEYEVIEELAKPV